MLILKRDDNMFWLVDSEKEADEIMDCVGGIFKLYKNVKEEHINVLRKFDLIGSKEGGDNNMYLYFHEVILVADKSKLHDNDPIVYECNYLGERILTLDNEQNKYTTSAEKYGRIYYDSADNPCIVPDTLEQFEGDCMCAKIFVPLP